MYAWLCNNNNDNDDDDDDDDENITTFNLNQSWIFFPGINSSREHWRKKVLVFTFNLQNYFLEAIIFSAGGTPDFMTLMDIKQEIHRKQGTCL